VRGIGLLAPVTTGDLTSSGGGAGRRSFRAVTLINRVVDPDAAGAAIRDDFGHRDRSSRIVHHQWHRIVFDARM
jgi:hypothetical protein